MAEHLKDMYGPDVVRRVGEMVAAVYAAFDTAAFTADALDGYEKLELTPRARHIARCLARHLPTDFEEAADVIGASLGPPLDGGEMIGQGMAPFVYLPHVFYVAEHGIDHWDTAMALQYELTQRMSCEFSIRAFIESRPEPTLAKLREWATDPNPHVRRLVSEGTRPRLPWAPRLRMFVEDPSAVISLLELLKDDPSTMVRRSVANNLNDIGKDHPGLLVEVCRRWMAGAGPERAALVRHALRSAVKAGDPGALAVLGFGDAAAGRVGAVAVEPPVAPIGGMVRVSFAVTHTGSERVAYNVDLRVHFVKASGVTSPKVFKVRQVELGAGETVHLAKSISLAQHTTRTHHPGEHPIEVVVNGAAHPAGSFHVVAGYS